MLPPTSYWIVIGFLALAILVSSPWAIRTIPGRIGLAIGATLVVLVGLLLFFTFPNADRIAKERELLFHTEAALIKAVSIDCEETRRPDLKFAKQHIEVAEKRQVEEIVSAIHTAKRFHPNHPLRLWAVLLTLHSDGQDVTVEIVNTTSDKNGVLIQHWSKKTSGWNLGTYRCDALKPVIEKLVFPP